VNPNDPYGLRSTRYDFYLPYKSKPIIPHRCRHLLNPLLSKNFLSLIQVSFNFTVPYVSEYQPTGLVYHYKAFQDYDNAIQKVIRDNIETVIINVEEDTMYEIFPAQDKYICWVGAVHGGTGPTRRRTSRKLAMAKTTASQQEKLHHSLFLGKSHRNNDPDDPPPQDYLGFVLPDLGEDRWKYAGKEEYNLKNSQRTSSSISSNISSSSIKADVWEWDLTEGEMEMKYIFYTDSSTGHPLELNMIGINLYTGGHKDNYIARYYNYEDVSVSGDGFPKGTFDPPVDIECTDAEPDAATTTTTITGTAQAPRYFTRFLSFLRNVLPSVHYGVNPQYDAFMHQHGRRHRSKKEYHTRHEYYQTSKIFVDSWNTNKIHEGGGDVVSSVGDGKSIGFDANNNISPRQVLPHQKRHRVALNRFADWSREEYRSLLGLKRKKENECGRERDIATAENFTSTPHFLPAQVIWKGTPADSPVKDQAACGR
jgi:Cathepsin propeptide inhibitor domain (I29)